MYLDFYGLRECPFNMTPDPEYLFLSQHHRVALDILLYGIRERKGFIAITGEVGSGKTTLCRALFSSLDPGTKTALILNPCLSDKQMLHAVCDEFRLQPSGQSKKVLYDAINGFLLREIAADNNVVLIIDEAQNLHRSVLEQIRLLSNLETTKDKLLQIILVGQPELGELLSRQNLRQLRQRITLRHHLAPLSAKECADYVLHRMHVAGADGNVMWTETAFDLIYKYSGGIPRLINTICDRALLAGYVHGVFTIEDRLVEQALEETDARLPSEVSIL